MNHNTEYLKEQTRGLDKPWMDLVDVVLDNKDFSLYPASYDKHHCYSGGLAEHTREVFDGCMFAAKNAKTSLNLTVLQVSAIWHDFGKLKDYTQSLNLAEGPPSTRNIGWYKTPHYGMVRHLSESYCQFVLATINDKDLQPKILEHISHCILAHHGRLDWGSPVEPKTPEAWALHLADMLSVRSLAMMKSP